MRCIFCFADDAKILFDRKSRPYMFCQWCSHRIFFHSPIAYKAILAWAETAKALTQDQFRQMILNMDASEGVRNQKVQDWIQQREQQKDVVVSESVEG